MSDMDEPTAMARRLAVVMSTVMNLSAVLTDEAARAACDPAALQSALTSLIEDLRWMQSLGGCMHGIPWPADADAIVASLDTAVTTWMPGEPMPQDVLASARRALEMLGVVPRP